MLAKKEHGTEIEQYLENNNVIAATCYYGDLVTKINWLSEELRYYIVAPIDVWARGEIN